MEARRKQAKVWCPSGRPRRILVAEAGCNSAGEARLRLLL
uniref:Uncharacterized protein n=1 Tax=Arundo donax TaxID=35708 RepID=A0A0A9A0N6_ARUDO